MEWRCESVFVHICDQSDSYNSQKVVVIIRKCLLAYGHCVCWRQSQRHWLNKTSIQYYIPTLRGTCMKTQLFFLCVLSIVWPFDFISILNHIQFLFNHMQFWINAFNIYLSATHREDYWKNSNTSHLIDCIQLNSATFRSALFECHCSTRRHQALLLTICRTQDDCSLQHTHTHTHAYIYEKEVSHEADHCLLYHKMLGTWAMGIHFMYFNWMLMQCKLYFDFILRETKITVAPGFIYLLINI